MATYAAAGDADDVIRSPRPSVLWAIALAGVVAAAGTYALASTGREVADPAVHSTLISWITAMARPACGSPSERTLAHPTSRHPVVLSR
jgi:hypothetical protein